MSAIAVVEKHRRQIELSPGVGSAVQQYGIAVCDDILSDLRAAGLGAVTPTNNFEAAQRAQGVVPAPTPTEVPLAPYMALMVALNHIEPGFENCRAVLKQWFDALPRTHAGSSPQPRAATSEDK